jgi:hypothetical protein
MGEETVTTTSDFEFVDGVVCRAEEKKAAGGAGVLSVEERRATAIWAASGIIGNGGFQYYFENDLSCADAAEDYESIGMPNIADIFRTALSLFPGGKPQSDWPVALAFIRTREELFDKLAAEVVRADSEMVSRLASHLRDAIRSATPLISPESPIINGGDRVLAKPTQAQLSGK